MLQSEASHLWKVFIVVDALDECSESNGTRDGFAFRPLTIREIQYALVTEPEDTDTDGDAYRTKVFWFPYALA